jgi:hypothetical protein
MPLLALLLQSQADIQRAQAMVPAFLAASAIIGAICILLIIIPTWFICKKAGFSPWLSLLVVVPMGGLVLLYVLAFAEWKVVPTPQTAYMPPVPPAFPPQA